MENDVPIKNGIVIPAHELEITASRAGGPGGQHVNKTNTRITVRWNVRQTQALPYELKERVLQKLHTRLTGDGELIVHNSASRSQQLNKTLALARLAQEVRAALYVQKKRMATRIPKSAKEVRLHAKTQRSMLKKLRSKKIQDY